MLLTLLGNAVLLGNAIVIVTIVSRAELRKKRVNIFILNLAVGDLVVCFVSMPLDIVVVAWESWYKQKPIHDSDHAQCLDLDSQVTITFAVRDLTVCFVSMPFHIVLMIFGQWVLGPVACKFSGCSYILAVAFSTFLLTALSIDRYQVRGSFIFLWLLRVDQELISYSYSSRCCCCCCCCCRRSSSSSASSPGATSSKSLRLRRLK